MKNSFYISDINVNDAVSSGNSIGFDDGNTDPALDDYEYNANGNLIKDRNKGITSISYNYLNLPELIIFENSNSIEYIYNALGVKLKKTVVEETATPEVRKEVDYLDGFQYAGGQLNFFPTAEGYVRATPTGLPQPGTPPPGYSYNYVFNYTDHLGNIRLSYTKDPLDGTLQILEENHYYPFGLRHEVYVSGTKLDFSRNPGDGIEPEPGLPPVLDYVTRMEYQYKYNGKELQDELGLNFYDYGARNYDPALGRFFNLDRLSEKYEAISPYGYVANNPVRFIDVNGEWIYITTTTGNKRNTYKYDNGDVYSEQTDDDGNKTWEKVDMSKSKDTDLQNSVDLLGKISASGDTGQSMLDFFNQEGNDLTVFAGHKYDSGANTARFDKRLSKVGLPVGHGLGTYLLDADPWLILAHEIGHVYGRYLFGQDVNNRKWFNMSGPKSPNQAEILASHIENMIRAESGIPLRTYYATETDQKGNTIYRGQLIDNHNRSIFFNNSTPPTIETNKRSVILRVKAENRYKY